eukprot:Skav215193  [mRNA]  locus=scaffold3330:125276:125737:- [translate_table: standard]
MDAMVPLQQGTVVPGPILQGTVAQGTAVAQPVAWHPWGVGESRPTQSMPPMPPVQQDMVPPKEIKEGQCGWWLYSIGWLCCCCVGPIGPLFWLVVACRYYRKPEEERKQLPNEGRVASISLVTAIVALVVMNVLLIGILIHDSLRVSPGCQVP